MQCLQYIFNNWVFVQEGNKLSQRPANKPKSNHQERTQENQECRSHRLCASWNTASLVEENIDTPTLNTDIIASVSRNGGSNFTNVTLADSGYVTGASGQRILTGQATISGQPSGQSMRWKLALANNMVKIHGVSLSWA